MMAVQVIGFLVLYLMNICLAFGYDSSSDEEMPHNVILVLAQVPTNIILQNEVEFDKSDGRSIYLNFPSKRMIKGCVNTNKTASNPIALLIRRSEDYSPVSCDDCREVLRNSVTSLLTWARNLKGMSEGLVATSTFFQRNSESVGDMGPTYQVNRRKRTPADKQKTELEKFDSEDNPLMELRKTFGKLRQGILSRILDVFGMGFPMEEENLFSDQFAANKLAALVQEGFQQITANSKGYLFVISGGELQDMFNPMQSAAAKDLDEAVRLVTEYTNMADTLIVVTGLCPDGNESNTDIPLYARGPGNEFVAKTKFLWQVPQSIRRLLRGRRKQHVPIYIGEVKPVGKPPTLKDKAFYLTDDDVPQRTDTTTEDHDSINKLLAMDARHGGRVKTVKQRRSVEGQPDVRDRKSPLGSGNKLYENNAKPSEIKTEITPNMSENKPDDKKVQASETKPEITQKTSENKSDDTKAQASEFKPEIKLKISENKSFEKKTQASDIKPKVMQKISENKSVNTKAQASEIKPEITFKILANKSVDTRTQASEIKPKVVQKISENKSVDTKAQASEIKPEIPLNISANKSVEKKKQASEVKPEITLTISENKSDYNKAQASEVKPEITLTISENKSNDNKAHASDIKPEITLNISANKSDDKRAQASETTPEIKLKISENNSDDTKAQASEIKPEITLINSANKSVDKKTQASEVKPEITLTISENKSDDNKSQASEIKPEMTLNISENKSDDKKAQASETTPEIKLKISENNSDDTKAQASEIKPEITLKISENKSDDNKAQASDIKPEVTLKISANISDDKKAQASEIKPEMKLKISKNISDDNKAQASEKNPKMFESKSDDKRAQASEINPEITPKISENKSDDNNAQDSEIKPKITPKISENKSDDIKAQASETKTEITSKFDENKREGVKALASETTTEVSNIDSDMKPDRNSSSRNTSVRLTSPSSVKSSEITVPQEENKPEMIQSPSNVVMHSETAQPSTDNSSETHKSTDNTVNVINEPPLLFAGNTSGNIAGEEMALPAQSMIDSVQMVSPITNKGGNKEGLGTKKYETVTNSTDQYVNESIQNVGIKNVTLATLKSIIYASATSSVITSQRATTTRSPKGTSDKESQASELKTVSIKEKTENKSLNLSGKKPPSALQSRKGKINIEENARAESENIKISENEVQDSQIVQTMNKTFLNTTQDLVHSSSGVDQIVLNTSQITHSISGMNKTHQNISEGIAQNSSKMDKLLQNFTHKVFGNESFLIGKNKLVNVSQPLLSPNGSQFIYDINGQEALELWLKEDKVGRRRLNTVQDVNAKTSSADTNAITASACILASAIVQWL